MISEVGTAAPAMPARWVYMHGGLNAAPLEGEVVIDTVRRRHCRVVIAEEKDSRGSGGCHLLLVAVKVDDGCVCFFSNEIVS